jgi:poly(ADP-ribose) glycohydrolase
MDFSDHSILKTRAKCLYFYLVPTGMITILRQQCPRIRFEDIDPPISDVKVELTGFIEDQFEEAHVDFANNFIGGGVLSSGTVQEEIRFIIAPETLISCLLCEQMSKHEAILILGSQQYSNYTGYSQTFQFKSSKKQPEFKRYGC